MSLKLSSYKPTQKSRHSNRKKKKPAGEHKKQFTTEIPEIINNQRNPLKMFYVLFSYNW